MVNATRSALTANRVPQFALTVRQDGACPALHVLKTYVETERESQAKHVTTATPRASTGAQVHALLNLDTLAHSGIVALILVYLLAETQLSTELRLVMMGTQIILMGAATFAQSRMRSCALVSTIPHQIQMCVLTNAATLLSTAQALTQSNVMMGTLLMATDAALLALLRTRSRAHVLTTQT